MSQTEMAMTQPYRPPMTDLQLDFFRSLLAPFDPGQLSEKPGRGGKPMTWLDKRALENRLDEVCTPLGWTIEYRPTARGFTARMGILCPTHDSEWVWVFKEDGAGYEEMDAVDDDEKSGYTNALRRVAQDAWGVGRYLYRKGIPNFLDPNARPSGPTPPPAPPAPVRQSPPAQVQSGPSQQNAAPAPAPQQPPAADQRDPNHFTLPKAGRQVFAWMKRMEDHFQTTLKNGFIADGESLGAGALTGQWNQEVVDEVCKRCVSHVRTLDNYNGELGYEGEGQPSGNAPPLPAREAVVSAPATGSSVSPAPAAPRSLISPSAPAPPSEAVQEARRLAANAITVYLNEVAGQASPQPAALRKAVADLSPYAANSFGHTGEVMASVGACNDHVWLNNLVAYIAEQVKSFRDSQKAAVAATDEIPF